jgi:hypothetical protein
MDLGQEIVHEEFREAFGPVHAFEEEAPEDFHDDGAIGGGKRQELTSGSENAVVVTIPKMLRLCFKYDRKLLGVLSQCFFASCCR